MNLAAHIGLVILMLFAMGTLANADVPAALTPFLVAMSGITITLAILSTDKDK